MAVMFEEAARFPLAVLNGILALFIGLHFVVISIYIRIKWRRNGVGFEQRKALALLEGETALLLPPDHPAAIPEEAHERWSRVQDHSLEALVLYILARTALGALFGHPQFQTLSPILSLLDSLAFLDFIAFIFLLSRLVDTFLAIRGSFKASSFIVDISNFFCAFLGVAAAAAYVSAVHSHASWSVYVIAMALMLCLVFVVGAISRSTVRSRGGDNILDRIDLQSTGLEEADFHREERLRSIRRNTIENIMIFFIPATLALPLSDESLPLSHPREIAYCVLVLLFVLCRLVYSAAFLLSWQPLRTISHYAGVLCCLILYGWLAYTLGVGSAFVSAGKEILTFATMHAVFLLLILLAIGVGCITTAVRIRFGVRAAPEDSKLFKRPTRDLGVGEVGAFQDVHRTVIEAIVLLTFATLAEELPGVDFKESMSKDWYAVIPAVFFVVATILNVFVSLHPRTRKYNIIFFFLSTFALLMTWATEEYEYYQREFRLKQ